MTCAFLKAPIKLGVISKQHRNDTQNTNSSNAAWITNNTNDTLIKKKDDTNQIGSFTAQMKHSFTAPMMRK